MLVPLILNHRPGGVPRRTVDVMPSGDGVVEIGRAVLTVETGPGATAQMEGKYVVYWRQESGQWKWHVDIWNTNS